MSNYSLTIFHASDLHVSKDENFLPDKMEQLIFVVRGTIEEYDLARAYVDRMKARSYLFVPLGSHTHEILRMPNVHWA